MRSRLSTGGVLLAVLVLGLVPKCSANLSTGLIAHYKLDGNADDSSGYGHDGIVNGATLTTDRFGNPNGAYRLDGLDDYVQVLDHPQLDGMAALTLSLWVNLDGADHEAEIVNKYLHGTGTRFDDSYNMGIDPGGRIAFQYATSNDYAIEISDAALDLGSWHHLAGVYTGTEGRIYIDGVLADLWRDDPDPGGILNSIDDSLFIGCANTASGLDKFFEGSIDDIRIYDRALTEGEIHDLSVVPLPSAAILGLLGIAHTSMFIRRRRS